LSQHLLYEERLTSRRTTALFVALCGLCLVLWLWRRSVGGPGWLSGGLGFLFVMFLFYSLNYRTLVTRLTPAALTWTFGLFRWTVPVANVESCALDSELAAAQREGGAGIHFMLVRGRYRASFNFLEYPRVVIRLKNPAGPVRDLSFSTRRPDEIMALIQARVSGTAPAG
jgi:hypothetical protein